MPPPDGYITIPVSTRHVLVAHRSLVVTFADDEIVISPKSARDPSAAAPNARASWEELDDSEKEYRIQAVLGGF